MLVPVLLFFSAVLFISIIRLIGCLVGLFCLRLGLMRFVTDHADGRLVAHRFTTFILGRETFILAIVS